MMRVMCFMILLPLLMAKGLREAHEGNESVAVDPCPIAPKLLLPTATFDRKFWSCAATHYLDTNEGRAELTYELFSGWTGEAWSLFSPKNHSEISTSKSSFWAIAKTINVEDCHGVIVAVLQWPVLIVSIMGQPVVKFFIENAAGETVAVVRQMPWSWTQRHEVALCQGGPMQNQGSCHAGTTVLIINYPYAVSFNAQWDITTTQVTLTDPNYPLVTSVQVVSQVMIYLIGKDYRATSMCTDSIITIVCLILFCGCCWFLACLRSERLRECCCSRLRRRNNLRDNLLD